MEKDTTNCYKCVHRRGIPGDTHSACNNLKANAKGSEHGIKKGWFLWPFNFDPVWLESCEGFSSDPKDALPERMDDPLGSLISLLSRRL